MKVFKLFANCIPVKGASVSIICDLQRGKYFYIPNELFTILNKYKTLDIQNIPNDEMEISEIQAYIDYFLSEELGFYTSEPDRFPEIVQHFESPEIINNAIIDCDEFSDHNYENIFSQLEILGCKFVELRFYTSKQLQDISEIINLAKGARFRNIDIYLKYSEELSPENVLSGLSYRYQIIGHITIHSAPVDRNYIKEKDYCLNYVKQSVTGSDCCGNISLKYFRVNVPVYMESQQYNNCLNKKIAIDIKGEIRNCPSMTKSFGNISEKTIIEVAAQNSFQEVWTINKDKISVCKDCQFRYICSDCRAYLSGAYDKPAKCGYDPYTNTWN